MAMDTGFKDENEERKKYKPGDKVRISKNPKDPHSWPKLGLEMNRLKGKIVTLKSERGGGCWLLEESYYSWWHERWFEDIESEESKETRMDKKYTKDLIIHCPTKELWARVVQKLLDEGYGWRNGDKEIHEGYWDGAETCVSLLEKYGMSMTFIYRSRLSELYPSIPITPAEEFLGDDPLSKETSEKKWNYPEVKFEDLRVGDKVLTSGNFGSDSPRFIYGEVKCIHDDYICIRDYVYGLLENESWEGKEKRNYCDDCDRAWQCLKSCENNLKFKLYLVERAKEKKDLIIHCPTKELWVKVVQKLLDEGYKWLFNDEKEIYTEYWKRYWADCDYKEESCVALFTEDNRRMWYSHRRHYQEQYPSIPITPAEEFLREDAKAKENLKPETKDSTAQPDASRVKEKQGIIPEEEARQILFWYYKEFLGEETEEYPLLDIRKAVLRQKLLNDGELAGLLKCHSECSEESRIFVQNDRATVSFRKAAKNLGVFLYQMITEKSEYTDISFHLDGYPPICKFSLKTSSSLNEVIENLANGRYRDTQKLKNDIQKLEEKTEEIEDSMNDESSDSIPQYEYIGGNTYVISDKNKQPPKSAPVPEWIVYQGAMVKNPDFISNQETVKEKSN